MSVSRPRIIRTVRLPEEAEKRITASFDAPPPPSSPLSTEEVFRLAAETKAQAVLVTNSSPVRADDAALIPESVGLIATVSVGLDHLDVKAITDRGILISNTPDVLTDCNADLTMLLILAASRRMTEYTKIIRDGWKRGLGMDELLGIRVSGKTLGIVGMGRIGQAVARRARGFGMTVLYNNRRRLDPQKEQGATWFENLEDMLPQCDILTLHLPGGPESDSLINAATLSLLPRGAVFVNAARGRLVDEDALIEALTSGQIAAAGLDVFRNEPDPDPRLISLPNVFATPHIGSATRETRTDMGMLALDNVEAFVQGKPLLTPVTA
ncbi:D-glycerate dehydrogenase [Acetobacter sp. AN02]|uniref:2-hydroxyacid dehydrogenase n=1 Tax=Acetobacter sp. AN02 TaxID=2894186 RepID=UPI0024345B04|nr:D-glycerate dehydrogenase [Acetobacter sp. AN02]MDG6094977.1 D-glycerate dehydrogenase [Acetobacter sp. AN02]